MRATITAPAAQIASERRFINMSFSNSIDERIYYISGIILQQEQYCKARQATHSTAQALAHSQSRRTKAFLRCCRLPTHFFVACPGFMQHIATAHKAATQRPSLLCQRAARLSLHKPQKSRRTGGSYLNIMCSYSIPPARLMYTCQRTGGNPIGTLC